MGIMDIFKSEKRSVKSSDPYLGEYFGVRDSITKQSVTAKTAVQVATVQACMHLISETLASVPLGVFERTDNGGRNKAVSHPLYDILHNNPNPDQDAYEFREFLATSVMLHGHGLAWIESDDNGRIVALWPLQWEHVTVKKLGGGISRYEYRSPEEETRILLQSDVLHVKYKSQGQSLISNGKEVIGLALAIQEFMGTSLANGARLGGIFQTDQLLSHDSMNKIRRAFIKHHTGTANARRALFLDSGLKYQPTSQNNQEMEFIALARLVNLDICRLFRVPPPAVGILDDATYSNITEQSRILVQNCIRPWTVRFEQAMNRALLSERDRKTFFIEHSLDGLLRGNLKDRYEAYKTGKEGGWLSVNDIRQRENMSIIAGGDEYQTDKKGVDNG